MIRWGGLQLEALAISRYPANDAPILWAYLPIESGLNVVYGLNGAGKSLLLAGLDECLSGRVMPRAHGLAPTLLVSVAADSVAAPSRKDFRATEDVLRLYERFASPGRDWDPLLSDDDGLIRAGDTRVRLIDDLDETTRKYASIVPPGFKRHRMAEEVVGQYLFALKARGTDTARWAAEVLARPAHDCPEIARVVHILPGAERAFTGERGALEAFWQWDPPGALSEPVAPPLFTPHYLEEWDVTGLEIPVLGGAQFDPDLQTQQLLRDVEFRLPDESLETAELWREFVELQSADPSDPVVQELLHSSVAERLKRRAFYKTFDFIYPRGQRLERLAQEVGGVPWMSFTPDGRWLDDACGVRRCIARLEQSANAFYARVLMDAPVLSLGVAEPFQWLTGADLAWGASRSEGSWVHLHDLSDAERKWARVAIEIALQLGPGGFLLIDEPEQALHRSAEAHMARELHDYARENDLCVVVATHSPELLNQPDAHVTLVRRRDQGLADGRQLVPLTDVDRAGLAEFGLLPSDLLRRQRGFLLVEGQHDLIVMREALGRELDELRVEVVPMRGAGRLAATLDSRVLYDFTDAHIFVMLDALRSDEIAEIWDEGVRLTKTEGAPAGVAYVDARMREIKVDEAGAFSAFLTRALERDLAERHTPLTLTAPDILEYLPVQEFVPNAASWQSLRDELTQSLGSTPSGSKFKAWLRSAKKADLSDDRIRRACRSMNQIPEEFTAHLERMRVVLAAR